jgi:hypothetical protein
MNRPATFIHGLINYLVTAAEAVTSDEQQIIRIAPNGALVGGLMVQERRRSPSALHGSHHANNYDRGQTGQSLCQTVSHIHRAADLRADNK